MLALSNIYAAIAAALLATAALLAYLTARVLVRAWSEDRRAMRALLSSAAVTTATASKLQEHATETQAGLRRINGQLDSHGETLWRISQRLNAPIVGLALLLVGAGAFSLGLAIGLAAPAAGQAENIGTACKNNADCSRGEECKAGRCAERKRDGAHSPSSGRSYASRTNYAQAENSSLF